jgi:23S rRNA pseudouridine2605 synthase
MKRKPKKGDKPFSKFYKKKPIKPNFDQPSYYASDEEEDDLPKKKRAPQKGADRKKATDKRRVNPKTLNPKFRKKEIVPKTHEAPVEENMRLNKYIAHAGICSRRKASEHIEKGAVMVNDVVVTEMGYKVKKDDVVKFQGEIVQPTRNHVYILLNKPKNVITTLQDENGRRTVLDFVSDLTTERIYPVGRLDRNTTGLLLLTNDGTFAQKLSHPSFGVSKIYKAKLDKALNPADLEKIRNTLQLEDGPAPVDAIEYGENNKTIGIEVHIGRNRIVRRIFEHLGYEVMKLDRVRYASLTKKNIPVGKCRFLTKQEIIILKHLA